MRRLACAVIGLGRAGRARVEALEAHPETRCVVCARHRPQHPEVSVEAVLARDDLDAFVISTPNALHPEQVSRALRAGAHVLVEFPLAGSVDRARELFELARTRERVLHVGHIEWIAPSQLALRERARELGPPRSGRVCFTANLEGWIADAELAGSAALRALARLHRLHDLFGSGHVRDARLEARGEESSGYRLSAEIEFASGGCVELIEERAPGLPRCTTWQVDCERGVLEAPSATSSKGVFAQDLALFVDAVRAQTEARGPCVDPVLERRELEVLAWVEQIEAGCDGLRPRPEALH